MTQPLIRVNINGFNYYWNHKGRIKHLYPKIQPPQSSDDMVLKKISLEIYPGEMAGIAGPNGAGKTTLLKIMSGILHLPFSISRDGIYINGYGNISTLKPSQVARIISWMPSDIGISYDYTIFETVLMGRLPYVSAFSSPSDEDIKAVKNAIEITELYSLNPEQRKISALSSGEKQLAFLAQVIAQNTPIMILDEPTAHLDIKHSLKILNIMHKLSQYERKTIIFTHHDINFLSSFATRVILLKNGSIIAEGSPPEKIITPENIKNLYSLSDEEEKSYRIIARGEVQSKATIP